jgi:transposase-like protein
VSAPSELSARPRRRTFTSRDKLRILAATDQAAGTGDIGAILRREGVCSSTLSDWRRQRAAGAFGALTPVKRGSKIAEPNPLAVEVALLQKNNAHLTRRLARADAIIAIQKNLRICWASQWRRTLTQAVVALSPSGGMTAAVCAAVGISRATVYRTRAVLTAAPVISHPRPRPARGLTETQQKIVLDLLHAPRFADQAPTEIYATLLDEGVYHCSIRTMYRIKTARSANAAGSCAIPSIKNRNFWRTSQ